MKTILYVLLHGSMNPNRYINIKDLIQGYVKGNFYQVDQNFLRERIYPLVINNSFTHDSYLNYSPNSKPFPSERINREFVGDVFDENENRHPEYYLKIY